MEIKVIWRFLKKRRLRAQRSVDSAGNEYDGQEKEEDGGEKSFFNFFFLKMIFFCYADSDWSSGGSEEDYDEEEDLVPKKYHLHLRE